MRLLLQLLLQSLLSGVCLLLQLLLQPLLGNLRPLLKLLLELLLPLLRLLLQLQHLLLLLTLLIHERAEQPFVTLIALPRCCRSIRRGRRGSAPILIDAFLHLELLLQQLLLLLLLLLHYIKDYSKIGACSRDLSHI